MAANDYAILVGISRYADPYYPSLDGPPNDVELFKRWLVAPNGGDVPAANILTIVSPAQFASDQNPMMAPPLSIEFDQAFLSIEASRMALKTQRVADRLYLYFSGHGFSSRDIQRGAEAALYAANASKSYYPHIYGTYFGNRAQAKALFQEIVLIMDCCRDAEANRVPSVPTLPNTPDDDLAANAWMLQVYAVPRAGKAQERQIAERGGLVHGLLTHALISAFEQARPSNAGRLSATSLREHVKQSWNAMFGEDAPPSPHFHLPTTEIDFNAQNRGVEVTLTCGAAAAGAVLRLRDGQLKTFAVLSATGDPGDDVIGSNSPILELQRVGSEIRLRMLPGLYQYEFLAVKGEFKVETGAVDVRL